MAAEAAAEIKEQYLKLCLEKLVEPHEFIFSALQEATKSQFLSGSDALTIDLSGNNKELKNKDLNEVDIEFLCNALIPSIALKSINFSYNSIQGNSVLAISKLIQESQTIEEVNLMCNDISKNGANYLAHSLFTAPSLKVLKVNGNKFGDEGGMFISKALKFNKTLQVLDLGDCDLKINSIISLATILRDHKYLKALTLNRPLLFSHQEETTVHISNMLKVNDTLEELHLRKFDIRDFGVKRLCEALEINCTLTYLDLNCNRMSRDGGLFLSEMLKCNQGLQILDLGNNRIEAPGASNLAAVLSQFNRTLHTLVLVNNEIKSDGLISIANAIQDNPVLTNVYIWGNFIDNEASTVFGELINSNVLKLRNTDVKPYVVDGQTYLAQLSHGLNLHYYWKPKYGFDYVAPFEELRDFA